MISSFRKAVACLRPGGAFDSHGRWVEGSPPSSFTIQASVQPMKPNEIALLEQGRRLQDARHLFTDFQLRTADDAAAQNPDRVTVDGKLYEVLSVESWQNTELAHYHAIIYLCGQAPTGVS